ncbi:PAS domain-containing protein [Halanaerobium kushneri]|uniref:PAS domain S-box-containing protein n=1 Tax=Halanaerobium kushneri TaxID=56779 RepID=A0A1N7ALU5_9FIRM|nr:PAS domain S-box protein [Halanaerobium kushneri]SIR39971.1 PAS domain S-box-containing protein [Halanaerobium kushneri]
MKEIIEMAELRRRFKLELDIMAEFFKTDDLKMAVLTSKNIIKIFEQQNNNFETAVKTTNLNRNLYKEIIAADDFETKAILAEHLVEFNSELHIFKVEAAGFIYIVYFPVNRDRETKNQESLKLFKKQFKAVLDDIYRQEEIKDDLSKKSLENKNLAKEKYFTASALDSVPGNISILDKEGNILYTNSSWEQFASENGAISKNVGVNTNYLKICKQGAEKGNLTSVQAYNGILSVLNDEQDSFSMDYPCHSPLEKRWFRMYVSSFKGIGDYEVMILHQNITKEIKAEKKSEEILNKLPAAILKFDSKHKLIYFNQKAMNLFELSEKDLRRRFNNLKIADQSGDDFIDKLNYAAVNRKRIEFKILISQDDFKKHYSNYLIPEFEGEQLKNIISIIPEEMSSRNTNQKNQNQRNHYLQLFDNFPEALVLLDIDEKIINVNKEFSQLFGYEIEELKNEKLDELIVPAAQIKEAQELSHLVLTGAQIEEKVKRINSQGEEIDLKLIAFPVLLNNNQIGVYAIYREIDKV